MTLVRVEFEDSRLPAERWQHVNEIDSSIYHAMAVGFVIEDNVRELVLTPIVGDVSGADYTQAAEVFAIPQSSIIHRVNIAQVLGEEIAHGTSEK